MVLKSVASAMKGYLPSSLRYACHAVHRMIPSSDDDHGVFMAKLGRSRAWRGQGCGEKSGTEAYRWCGPAPHLLDYPKYGVYA